MHEYVLYITRMYVVQVYIVCKTETEYGWLILRYEEGRGVISQRLMITTETQSQQGGRECNTAVLVLLFF